MLDTPNLTATPTLGPLDWRWQNPLPDGTTWNGVWCASKTDIFVVGAGGAIKHYDGIDWRAMSSGTTATLSSVWGSSPTDVFAIGGIYQYAEKKYAPVILHYNGKAWSEMAFHESGYALSRIWGSSASDVYVSGGKEGRGVILHYDGSAWSVQTEQFVSPISVLWGLSGSDIYAISNAYVSATQTYESIIYHFDGQSWKDIKRTEKGSDMRGDTLRDIWGSSPNDLFAVGERIYNEDTESHNAVTMVIYHFEGNTWNVTTSGTGRLFAVWGSSATDVYAVMGMQGDENTYLHYDGTAWTAKRQFFGNYLLDVHGASSKDVCMVGYDGLIMHGDQNKWKQASGMGATLKTIYAMWGSSNTDVYAVGGEWDYPDQQYRSVMYHYDGSAWNTVDSETDRYNDTDGWGSFLRDIWGTSSNNVFYVERGGRIHHLKGSTWSRMDTGIGTWVYGIWGSSSSDIFAVGQDGVILHYDGNKEDFWTPMSSGTKANLNDVWGSSSSDVFAVGYTYDSTSPQSNPIILHYDGSSWSEMETGVAQGNFSGVWVSADGEAFVVGSERNVGTIILHYNGTLWSKMDNSASAIMSIYSVWGFDSADVYAVGNGGIIHYDGNSWSTLFSSTDITLYSFWRASPTDMFAGGRGGAILHYSY
jgi:hypothetical protein